MLQMQFWLALAVGAAEIRSGFATVGFVTIAGCGGSGKETAKTRTFDECLLPPSISHDGRFALSMSKVDRDRSDGSAVTRESDSALFPYGVENGGNSCNENENIGQGDNSIDSTTATIRKVLDWMKNSKLIDEKHAEHRASQSVTHLFKGTPLVDLPPEWKLKFVSSWAGRLVESVMKEEQSYLGDWKIDKIMDAAGPYNSRIVSERISEEISSHPVVVYSFVDCPWCVAAKELLLRTQPYKKYAHLTKVVELEDLGVEGKYVRAELAKLTGRTSMPCIFVNGTPIGGFTDGYPVGPGLRDVHESGSLLPKIILADDN